MVYAELVLFVIASALAGLGALILMEVRLNRREQRWLDRVSR
jgi:hypothetical protein